VNVKSTSEWLEKLGVSFEDFLDPEKASCVPFDPSAEGVELCAPYIAEGAQGGNLPFHVLYCVPAFLRPLISPPPPFFFSLIPPPSHPPSLPASNTDSVFAIWHINGRPAGRRWKTGGRYRDNVIAHSFLSIPYFYHYITFPPSPPHHHRLYYHHLTPFRVTTITPSLVTIHPAMLFPLTVV
jgi:hypothetical protein